ncbi:hypothetical protein QJS04_geneDACA014780 [Acorus gramineus]|uniref:DUF6817 domain-containing protein n=1 Tax=Acorus gramineus TaxID=55184 RepID=A0AAV9BSB0_ACOGR|nr:hypothetical protein QJS04_geneDACA014780 [Acorus gramineus]
MPSYTSPSSSNACPPQQKQQLQDLIDSARPFLRGELETVDPALPSLISVLRSAGAGECWHKHGSFLDHLMDVYKILKLWSAPDEVARCGLFHSAYSNSYVNLAIFDAATSRDHVRRLIGDPAENLIHLFCVVPRQPLIHDDLLFQYPSESELVEHLKSSEESLLKAREEGIFDPDEPWQRKIRSVLPPDGVVVKHIKTGEDLRVSRRVVATFLMMTMADFSDQIFGFQDSLFENIDGRLGFAGNNHKAIWPGDGKPGLWMNSISRMGAIYSLIVRDEEIMIEERKRSNGDGVDESRDEQIELVIPPVLEGCTRILDAEEQIKARDLYWKAVACGEEEKKGEEEMEGLLLECVERNPFVGEPHLVLGQLYMGMGRYEEAEREAERGLRLVVEWGSPWDKRMSWEGWVAWGRVILMKARVWESSSSAAVFEGLDEEK